MEIPLGNRKKKEKIQLIRLDDNDFATRSIYASVLLYKGNRYL